MVNVLILAGDSKGIGEQKINKALIRIKERPMIEYELETLEKMEEVGKIVLIAPKEEFSYLKRGKVEVIDEPVGTLAENFLKGAQYFDDAEHIFLMSADIPMITETSLIHFLDACQNEKENIDMFYPVVKQEDCLKAYPSVERTYFRLKEGKVTGGNVFYVNVGRGKILAGRVDEFLEYRKKPLKMASKLGFSFLIQMALGICSMKTIEDKVAKIIGLRGKMILSPYAEIGTDVDKPSDLLLAEEIL